MIRRLWRDKWMVYPLTWTLLIEPCQIVPEFFCRLDDCIFPALNTILTVTLPLGSTLPNPYSHALMSWNSNKLHEEFNWYNWGIINCDEDNMVESSLWNPKSVWGMPIRLIHRQQSVLNLSFFSTLPHLTLTDGNNGLQSKCYCLCIVCFKTWFGGFLKQFLIE